MGKEFRLDRFREDLVAERKTDEQSDVFTEYMIAARKKKEKKQTIIIEQQKKMSMLYLRPGTN